jgi:hypothetical protein
MFHGVLKDILPFVEANAPLLAKSLGYPGFNQTTQWAMNLISKAFHVGTDISKLPDAIKNDTDAAGKLVGLDNTFKDFIMNSQKDFNIRTAEVNIKLEFDTTNKDMQ